jgi:hypothetical protein
MTEAARRNRFWNYDSPNCCNSGVLNNIHRTERKGWRKTALFLPAPESLSWEKNAVIHSVSKGCQEFVRRLIALTPAQKRRIELAQSPGPGKGLHDKSITEIALRVRSVMLPNCPILFFLIINLKTGASSSLQTQSYRRISLRYVRNPCNQNDWNETES